MKKMKLYNKTILSIIICFSLSMAGYAQQLPDSVLLNMMPEIPPELSEPAQRADYLVLHYWDNYSFNDISFLLKDYFLEQSLVDYLGLLTIVAIDTRDNAIKTLMKKAEKEHDVFLLLLKLCQKYLYESMSPLYDEEKLIPFLQYAVPSSSLDDSEKIRPKFVLENILKNRTGHVANDFTYTLVNKNTGTMHSIEAGFTLIYFNDPGCEDCMELTKQLAGSSITNDLINQGKLKILTVYTSDDVKEWEEHASIIPDTWIYSRDAEQKINFDELYNIKQFPTIYLLDKDKKVLLKDTTFENLENYFKIP